MRNAPFSQWAKTLTDWEDAFAAEGLNHKIEHIRASTIKHEAFDFIRQAGLQVEVAGPVEESVSVNGQARPALRFFRSPESGANMHHSGAKSKSLSASRTINGHSIAFRLTFGNVRIALTGDLNQESMELIRSQAGADDITQAEIVKAPHHGSHDFDLEALIKTEPVVGIISSGDESAQKEFVHPRATLMAALGQSMSRSKTGVIFCTELAAFFSVKGYGHTSESLAAFFGHKDRKNQAYTGSQIAAMLAAFPKPGAFSSPDEAKAFPKPFFGFERTNFGIVHIRTDGERVLVFTHSGKEGLNEAYAFTVDDQHKIAFKDKPETR